MFLNKKYAKSKNVVLCRPHSWKNESPESELKMASSKICYMGRIFLTGNLEFRGLFFRALKR
jgi:hypothetical protein